MASLERANPATPAMAIWASDAWPANPVSTTSDSASTMAISEVMIAARHSGPNASRPTTAASTGTSTLTGVSRAGGTGGSFQRSVAPRPGRRSPCTAMATMITRNGRPSLAPYLGNQERSTCSLVKADWTIPIASPTATVTPMLRNLPTSAAPSAGMR